jgi:hypothetical protein
MSRGKSRRSQSKSRTKARWSLHRLLAIWAAGLVGSFALGLYLFAPDIAPLKSGTDTAETAPGNTLPAEIAIESAAPSAESKLAPERGR